MVTVSCSPPCRRMEKVFIVKQYNPSYFMNWGLQSIIAASQDDQVSGIGAMTVLFLYMVNFLLPFPASRCWQGICEYEVIYRIRLWSWLPFLLILWPLFNRMEKSSLVWGVFWPSGVIHLLGYWSVCWCGRASFALAPWGFISHRYKILL